jgi:LAO/AO transport system kinase
MGMLASPNMTSSPPLATNALEELQRRFRAGDKSALARLITLIESQDPRVGQVMERLYPAPRRGHVVGITGPPGAGKSSLINQLILTMRGRGRRVAVVAIDPSSPFSGGALLGDRVRMADHYRDEGVFIRSLATRGAPGGLSLATREVVRLLQSFTFDSILIETAGVGQTELAIMEIADTTVVVMVPESGDGIQVMKAGLLEIADIFVVNKADREGAARLRTELMAEAALGPARPWQPPVLLTQASSGAGLEPLLEEIDRHQAFLRNATPCDSNERCAQEFSAAVRATSARHVTQLLAGARARGLLEQVRAGLLNPYAAARLLLQPALEERLDNPHV